MKKTKLLKRQIDLLKLSLNLFKTDATLFAIRRNSSAFVDCFYKDGTMLKEEFVESIPVKYLSEARDLLDFLRSVSEKMDNTYYSTYRNIKYEKEIICKRIELLIKYLEEEIKDISSNIIFYCWQSDLPSKTNNGFIRDCLEKAIKRVESDLNLKLVLDSDTRNVPGSPDIITSILDKIDNSAIFVGDVSILPKDLCAKKYQCNQNVMFETGYALKSLSYERIVLICNTSYGELKDLPFDLGLKRVIDYKLKETDEIEQRKTIKEKMVSELYISIKTILSKTE